MRNKLIAIVLGLLTVSIPLFAHHGAAAYDTSKKLALKGIVTEWFWANPHCFLRFDVKDDKGNVVHWAAEVTVTVEPVKNGLPIGRIDQVALANGQILKGRVVF